ncbi:MAG: hypothetical protein A2096_11265 [Spirochaetes bacterium GWF1_41_5]|nr:MAG: hypothetical protein A2096_11265 [Spirochaetes bacterium GWF1_41_5]HBE02444.1 hypothetical protein [Spirochaetia bacterium]
MKAVTFITVSIILLFSEDYLILSNLILAVKERNPEITSMRQKVSAAKENIKIKGSWNQPKIGTEYYFSENRFMFEALQTIPFPGKTSSKIKIAKLDAAISEQMLSAKTFLIISEIKKAYYMYYLAYNKNRVINENLDLMKQYAANADALYAAGKSQQSDLLKANAEIVIMENMMYMHNAEIESSISMIRSLLDYNADKKLGIPEEINIKPVIFSNLSLDLSPVIKIKNIIMEKNLKELGLSRLEWLPDFMTGIKYDTMEDLGVMVSAEIPVYFFRQAAEVRKMKYESEMAENELLNEKNITRAKLDALVNNYKAKLKSAENSKNTVIPLREQTLKVSEAAYRAGKGSFLDLLDSADKYLKDRHDYYETVIELKFILAEIEQITGKEIE